MGYTHYWEILPSAPAEAFGKLALDCKLIFDAAYTANIPLGNGMGVPGSSPEIEEGIIRFNGVEPHDYETFSLSAGRPIDFGYCKTGYHPYDIVVCVVLLRAKFHYGGGISVSSDGSWDREDEWLPARNLYSKIFGTAPPNLPEVING